MARDLHKPKAAVRKLQKAFRKSGRRLKAIQFAEKLGFQVSLYGKVPIKRKPQPK